MTIEASPENITFIADYIKSGKVCVLPTDTLYGFSCNALNHETVERIYSIKQREKNKPFIILISNINDLHIFGVQINSNVAAFLHSVWPGKVTVILNCPESQLDYLHGGGNSLAFRLPEYPWLVELLERTGPVVSTSVNIAEEPPLLDLVQIEKVFGNKVDIIVDAGKLVSEPSTIVSIENDKIKVIREGAVKITNLDLNNQITNN